MLEWCSLFSALKDGAIDRRTELLMEKRIAPNLARGFPRAFFWESGNILKRTIAAASSSKQPQATNFAA
ncbi:MAG: hypothetical protein WD077_02925 [Bacteroidia bacterium]